MAQSVTLIKKQKKNMATEKSVAVLTPAFISGLRQAEKDFDAGKTRKIKSLRDLVK